MVASLFIVVPAVLSRLVTTSYVEELGIAVGVGAIVGIAGHRLQKRRSRVSSTETDSNAST